MNSAGHTETQPNRELLEKFYLDQKRLFHLRQKSEVPPVNGPKVITLGLPTPVACTRQLDGSRSSTKILKDAAARSLADPAEESSQSTSR